MFALTTVVVLFCVSYTFALFLVSRRRNGALLPRPDRLFFIFIVPCLNEEMVIGRSLDRLLALSSEDAAVLVVDDASSDDTANIVESYQSERVWLLRRRLPNAQKGKGAALNAAYDQLLHERQLPVPPDQVIVCVVDADRHLAANALVALAAVIRAPKAGTLQIGVPM